MKPILTYGTKLYDVKRNLSIVLFLIDKCNYSCRYCGNKFPRTGYMLNLDKTYEELMKVSQMIDGKIFVDLLGGEPTLHPYFYSFCQKISQIDKFKISVYTNFSASREMYIDLFMKGIDIVPSWHSLPNDLDNSRFIDDVIYVAHHINRRMHSRVMYEPYASKQSIKAFNMLHANSKTDVEFSLLVDAPQFKVEYSDEQLDEYLKCQNEVHQENNDICLKFDDGSSKLVGYYDLFKNDDVDFRFWKCNAGMDTLYVHSNGNAYPCPKFYTDNKKPIFNIYEDGMKLLTHPLICTFKNSKCECDKEVMKQKVINA